MKKSLFAKSFLVAGILALASASSWASVVTWDLNPGNLNQALGSPSHVFTSDGFNITATGYDHSTSGSDTLHQLYYKSEPMVDGATERGLGLFNTNANELNINANGSVAQYIQLDLRAILAQGFTNGMIAVSSMQNGEGFRLFGSNSQGVLGTQLPGIWSGLAFDNQFVAVPQFGQFQFLSIAANTGRIIPSMFSVTPIPEMSALLPIAGLLAAVGSTQLLRRRVAARANT
jgi:hypothetical protein